MSDNDYRECASCADKPGMPTLCDACLHNRALVNRLLLALDAEKKKADVELASERNRVDGLEMARASWQKRAEAAERERDEARTSLRVAIESRDEWREAYGTACAEVAALRERTIKMRVLIDWAHKAMSENDAWCDVLDALDAAEVDLPGAPEVCDCEHQYKRGACPYCDAAEAVMKDDTLKRVAEAARRAARLFACSGTHDGDLAAEILEELAHEIDGDIEARKEPGDVDE